MVIKKFVFNGEKSSICISTLFVSTYILSTLAFERKLTIISRITPSPESLLQKQDHQNITMSAAGNLGVGPGLSMAKKTTSLGWGLGNKSLF